MTCLLTVRVACVSCQGRQSPHFIEPRTKCNSALRPELELNKNDEHTNPWAAVIAWIRLNYLEARVSSIREKINKNNEHNARASWRWLSNGLKNNNQLSPLISFWHRVHWILNCRTRSPFLQLSFGAGHSASHLISEKNNEKREINWDCSRLRRTSCRRCRFGI